jgi:hypothetical protein
VFQPTFTLDNPSRMHQPVMASTSPCNIKEGRGQRDQLDLKGQANNGPITEGRCCADRLGVASVKGTCELIQKDRTKRVDQTVSSVHGRRSSVQGFRTSSTCDWSKERLIKEDGSFGASDGASEQCRKRGRMQEGTSATHEFIVQVF